MAAPIGDPSEASGGIPVLAATATLSFNPVRIPVAGRAVPLDVRVTAPATGKDLPIIILSHGHGPSTFVCSSYGYGPLVTFWAAHGFVVLQPCHLDATYLGLRESREADAPLFFNTRAADIGAVLDNLDVIEGTVPGLAGRVDRSRVGAVGHSLGGSTVAAVSGVGHPVEPRIGARVLIGVAGGAEGCDGPIRQVYPQIAEIDYTTMTPQVLVVASDKDFHPTFSSRVTWRREAFDLSPSPKTLLDVTGAGHGYGGIAGFDARETTDENPARVAAVRTLIWAYLRSQLYEGDSAWQDALAVMEKQDEPVARVETK